jgi:hypothetical protein
LPDFCSIRASGRAQRKRPPPGGHEATRGLAKETVLVEECDDPLLYRERQDYRQALREALAGVEDARVVLAKARQRLEGHPSRG